MPEGRTAGDRLRRILHLLPAAARDDGVRLERLASDLGVDVDTVLGDLEELTGRTYYLPAGAADDLQIQITGERVRVWTTGEFRRPVRLLAREALALGLGLRALDAAGAAPGTAGDVRALRRRLEEHLATRPSGDFQPRFEPGGGNGEGERDGAVHGVVFACARRRRACRIRYLKPGASGPERRTVEPWSLVRAEGKWYVVGRDPAREGRGVRIFRTDRILEAEETGERFRVPDDFDPAEHVERGRVYRSDGDEEVAVRYSPRIARWIREKRWAGNGGPSEEREDGSIIVRHRVADPDWIVRHVLRYGPDARILEPDWARERVARIVEEIVA